MRASLAVGLLKSTGYSPVNYEMFDVPITKTCPDCGKHFVGLPEIPQCPQCDEDRQIYTAARKRGDKRKYIPYVELLKEWKNRVSECRSLRRTAEQTQQAKTERERLEKEKRWLLLALNNTLHDADLLKAVVMAQRDAEDLKKKADHLESRNTVLREEILRLNKENLELSMKNILNSRQYPSMQKTSAIPTDMWRRLLQLAHPDKHGGSEAATKATQWLLENRG